jgi:hypothetical protein
VVSLKDGSFKVGLTVEDIVSKIPKYTELIGFSVPFSHLASLSHSLIIEIKNTFPSVPLVMGSIYPSLNSI